MPSSGSFFTVQNSGQTMIWDYIGNPTSGHFSFIADASIKQTSFWGRPLRANQRFNAEHKPNFYPQISGKK